LRFRGSETLSLNQKPPRCSHFCGNSLVKLTGKYFGVTGNSQAITGNSRAISPFQRFNERHRLRGAGSRVQGSLPFVHQSEVIWGTMPFVLLMMLAVLMLCFVPEISTWLPDLVMGPDGGR